MTTQDFSGPVELRCIVRPDDTVRRTVPLMIISFAAAVAATGALASYLLDNLLLGIVLGALLGTVLCWMLLRQARSTPDRTNQRLILSVQGLTGTDGTLTTRMAWGDVRAVTTPKGANRVGIVGNARLTADPSGDRVLLDRYAAFSTDAAVFRRGETVVDEGGALFPGDFEADWRSGTVGRWLRHYRPDLNW